MGNSDRRGPKRDIDPFAFLSRLPKRRQDTIKAVLRTIQTHEAQHLAVFWKFIRPELSDARIATLCGVCRATLAEWERYQWAKEIFKAYKREQRPPSKWRKGVGGNRLPLDPPDRI